MTKIKTSELEGAALNWAVAKACGIGVWVKNGRAFQDILGTPDRPCSFWSPSRMWDQGGPLIERYEVALSPEQFGWEASVYDGGHMNPIDGQGPTPLIAACRAIVAAKLGDVVEVPDELTQ